jgi:ERCC4-related helicase
VEFRLYQKRIAETASERNTLVILPTALGKAVISAMGHSHFNRQNPSDHRRLFWEGEVKLWPQIFVMTLTF